MNIPRGYQANTRAAGRLGAHARRLVERRRRRQARRGVDRGRRLAAPGRRAGRPDAVGRRDPQGIYRADSHMWLFPPPTAGCSTPARASNMNWIDTQRQRHASLPAGTRGDDELQLNGNAVMYDIGKILKVGGAPGYEGIDANANSLRHRHQRRRDGAQGRAHGLRARLPQQRGAAQRPGRRHRRPDLGRAFTDNNAVLRARAVGPGHRDVHRAAADEPCRATTTASRCCCPTRACCPAAAACAAAAARPTTPTCRSSRRPTCSTPTARRRRGRSSSRARPRPATARRSTVTTDARGRLVRAGAHVARPRTRSTTTSAASRWPFTRRPARNTYALDDPRQPRRRAARLLHAVRDECRRRAVGVEDDPASPATRAKLTSPGPQAGAVGAALSRTISAVCAQTAACRTARPGCRPGWRSTHRPALSAAAPATPGTFRQRRVGRRQRGDHEHQGAVEHRRDQRAAMTAR